MARTLDVNHHLAVVGGIGRPQWISLILIGLMITQFGWQMLSVIFTLKSPNFRCSGLEFGDVSTFNGTTSASNQVHEFDNKCEHVTIINNVSVSKNCTEFVYDREYGQTAVERYNLVCGRKHLSAMTEMIYMGAAGFGTLGGSYFSDRFGRKIVIIISCITAGIIGIIQAFSEEIIMYTTLRVANGMFTSSFFTPSFSLMMESVSPKRRPDVLNALEMFWILGAASLSLIGYFLKDWWKIQIFCNVPGILLSLAMIWLVDESPHWLASHGQVGKALKVLQNMGKGKDIDTKGLSFEASDYAQEKNGRVEKKESFLSIWVHKRLVIRFLIFTYAWTTCTLFYYVLTFGVRTLPGNLYVNNFISAAVEAMGYLICFCISWWGRKGPTIAAFLSGSSVMLVSVLVENFSPGSDKVITAMSMLGKMCITAAWQMIIVWSSELYPTTHRCTLVSLNIVIAKLGGVLAPFVIQLEDFIDVPNEKLIVPILFVILMVSAGLLHIILPETNRRVIPEVIKEANSISLPFSSSSTDTMPTDSNETDDAEAEKFDLLQPEEQEKNV